MAQESTLSGVQERQIQLISSITQRLKWAAGANPSLTTVLKQFEEALGVRNKAIEVRIIFLNNVF